MTDTERLEAAREAWFKSHEQCTSNEQCTDELLAIEAAARAPVEAERDRLVEHVPLHARHCETCMVIAARAALAETEQ